MAECEKEENTIVCLFEDKTDIIHDDEDDNFFHDKLDKTDIYNKDDEEIYIATSPSFSMSDTKQSIVDMYNEDNNQRKSSDDCEDHLKCDTAFSDISNDSHSVEYPLKENPVEYQTINNTDNQSYFISSDYSQINNMGIELSNKGYFYVLSPMGNTSTLVRTLPPDDALTQPVDTQTLLPTTTINTNTTHTDIEINLKETRTDVTHNKVDVEVNEQNTRSMAFAATNHDMEVPPSTAIATTNNATDYVSFSDYVNFMPGMPESPSKQNNTLTWHRVLPPNNENKRTEIQNPLLMKYDNDNKMEVPLINGQPYLQVALVNDMDASSTSELVCADQILGVAVPEMFSCKWEGCGAHVFANEELINHVNNSHITPDHNQHYQCYWKGCVREGRPFNARYKMVIHLRTHTGEKPHTCPVKDCGQSFGRIENMRIHVRSHTGEKPYPCPYEGCDKVFANSSDRFKHGRTHREKKPFRCNIIGCDKSYTDPSSLRKHKKRHFAGTLPVNNSTKKLAIT